MPLQGLASSLAGRTLDSSWTVDQVHTFTHCCCVLLQGLASSLAGCALNVNELRAALRLLAAIAQPSDAQGLWDLQKALRKGQLLVPSASGELAPLGSCAHMHTAPTRLLNRCSKIHRLVHKWANNHYTHARPCLRGDASPQLPIQRCTLGLPSIWE